MRDGTSAGDECRDEEEEATVESPKSRSRQFSHAGWGKSLNLGKSNLRQKEDIRSREPWRHT